MSSIFNLDLFSAVLLAALLLCASGAPVGDESTAGGFSGEEIEEERSSFVDLLANLRGLIHSTHQIQKAFERESKSINNYDLKPYEPSTIPKKCNTTQFRKESCLQTLVRGLHIYSGYLRSAEKEYPRSLNFSDDQSNISKLTNLANILKQKMKNPNQATEPTITEVQQMLKLTSPYAFHRRMRAHSILNHLFEFLKDMKRSLCRMEMKTRRNMAVGMRLPSADIDC